MAPRAARISAYVLPLNTCTDPGCCGAYLTLHIKRDQDRMISFAFIANGSYVPFSPIM